MVISLALAAIATALFKDDFALRLVCYFLGFMFILKVQPMIERYFFRGTRRRSSDYGSSGSSFGSYDSSGGGSDCGWGGSSGDSGGGGDGSC